MKLGYARVSTPEKTRALTWSYGGGTQSVAIAVLVARGELPRPECTVIADTGREASETWEYTDRWVSPLLASVGIVIERAPHTLSRVDLYSLKGELSIPAFTSSGALGTFCSTEWKKRVIQRFLRSKEYGPEQPVTTWIGISRDEIGRAKPSDREWQEYAWPLLWHSPSLRRSDCVRIVESAGLPTPPKSSCWMCPFRRNSQWRHLKEQYPADWARAVALDEQIRERDQMGGVYLHDSRVPLVEADLSDPDPEVSTLFGEVGGGCDSGMCWV